MLSNTETTSNSLVHATATVFVNNIYPKSLTYAFMGYFMGVISYNIVSIYNDAKDVLICFRNNQLDKIDFIHSQFDKKYLQEKVKDDWSAVKYGAGYRSLARLWDSIIWPFTVLSNAIPALVLKLNPAPKNKDL